MPVAARGARRRRARRPRSRARSPPRALGWVALVAVMTQAGYAGNPRYNVAAAAVGCVLAGVGVAAVARLPADQRRRACWSLAAALAAAVLAFTAGDLADQVDELGERADRRTELDALVDARAAPQRSRVRPARTNQPMKAMLAWRLDVRDGAPRRPAAAARAVFRARPATPASRPSRASRPALAPVARDGRLDAAYATPAQTAAARSGP